MSARAGEVSEVRVTACNAAGVRRHAGGDLVQLRVMQPPPPPNDGVGGKTGGGDAEAAEAVEVRTAVVRSTVDHRNGRYTLSFTTPQQAGAYLLELHVNGERAPGVPLMVSAAAPHAAAMRVTLERQPAPIVAGESVRVTFAPHDRFGNPCHLDRRELAAWAVLPPPTELGGHRQAAEAPSARPPMARQTPDGRPLIELAVRRAVRAAPAGQPPHGQQPSGGELSALIGVERAGMHALRAELGGETVPTVGVRFTVLPAATDPARCRVVERPGERGLCKSASPPRRLLMPNAEGHCFTIVACDRYGNARTQGGDDVRVSFGLHSFGGTSKLARRLKSHLGPHDPAPPAVEDRQDGSYAVRLPGTRPCHPPPPAVARLREGEDDAKGRLSAVKWVGRVVRYKGSEMERLAIVDAVVDSELVVRWVADGTVERGRPATLLGGVDASTIVSDKLGGYVDVQHVGRVEVRGIESAQAAPGEPASGELRYRIDDGENVYQMGVSQLLMALEARREELLASGAHEVLSGDYLMSVEVDGTRVFSEALKFVNTFEHTRGGRPGDPNTRLDWKRDWASVVRSLEFRGLSVEEDLEAVLLPHVPLLQDLYIGVADRSASMEAGMGMGMGMGNAAAGAATAGGGARGGGGNAGGRGDASGGGDAGGGGGGGFAGGGASGDGRMGDGARCGAGGGRTRATRPSLTRTASGMIDAVAHAAGSPPRAAEPSVLKLEDWWELSKACSFTECGGGKGGRRLSQAQIDELLPAHVTRSSVHGTAGTSDGSGKLAFTDFMEGLVMLATAKVEGGQPLGAALEKLLVEKVAPSVLGRERPMREDPVRTELQTVPCRKAVHEMQRPLRELYRHWSGADERDAKSDLLSCKEVLMLLQRAGVIGSRLSVVQTKGFLISTLYESCDVAYANDHDNEHLVFGDFVEVLARCATEFFKLSSSLTDLPRRLRCLVDHAHQTTYVSGQLNPLKDPRHARAHA